MGERDHFVQFSESDELLVHAASGFLGSALARGDAGIVVATEPHRVALARALDDLGLNVTELTESGCYVALDAVTMLSRVCVAGWPDEQLFRHAFEPAIAKLTAGGRPVRAFGEMAPQLVAAGDRKAAVRLEELANAWAKNYPISIYCAYPIGADLDSATLGAVCRAHAGCIIPGESYALLESTSDRLRAIVELQQRVASLEADAKKRAEIDRAFLRRLRPPE